MWAGAGAVVALGVGQLIGHALDRARPYAVMPNAHVLITRTSDFSVPSDHATAVGAVALYALVKPLVGRPRPTLGPLVSTATGYSFPSGHATQAAAVYGALVIVWTRHATSVSRTAQAWAAATVGVFLVGASRVYLGVHWPTDVLAGWALGAFWLAALLASIRAINVRRRPTQ